MAAAFLLNATALALVTYYKNIAHASPVTPWPSDILFVLWIAPAIMTLLPRSAKEPGTIDWQLVLDFAQVGVVALTAYLYFFYVSSRWEAEGHQMVLKLFRLEMICDMTLAAAFLIRSVTVAEHSIRSFFRRIFVLFLLAGASEIVVLIAPFGSRTRATWTDFIWCTPYLFAALIAATWNRPDEPLTPAVESRFRTVIVSQALPILIPLLVLLMGRRIAAEQITIAWIAITASFILSGARLILTNEKQRRLTETILQAEQALLRSERMFSTAFRLSPDAVGISLLPEGRFLEVNEGFTRYTGYSRQEVLGKSSTELNLWVDVSHRTMIMTKLQEHGEVQGEEFKCRTKKGEIRVGEFSGSVIELDGKLYALVIVHDITARKQAEEALRASEARFRHLVQDLHVGVVLLGPDAKTTFANQAALETFGLDAEDTMGKSTSNFDMTAIREDGSEIPFAMRPGPRAIATKQPIRSEMVGWRRGNSEDVLWTLVDAVPHFTAEGDVANVILTISNVTERKLAEEALRASEERFRTLVRDFHVGVVLLGPNAEIQFANRAAQQMFGMSLEEVKGKSSGELDLISVREDGTEIPFLLRPGPRSIDTRLPVQSEVIGWRRKDSNETLWTLGNAVPQFAPDGSVSTVINTFTNITERKQAEEALHQLSTRLLQLQDEERRRLGRELHDSLAQSVLAVNLNLAQATQSASSLDDRSRKALAEARRVLVEMSREIRTLSYLLHPPLLDELGLVSAVKEYAEGFSERSGIALELDIQAGFARLPQEAETALFRIVQESLANIQRHSGSKTAKIRLREDSARVSLEVSDQGRGWDKNTIKRGNGSRTRLGVGILGMRERMSQLGGKLEIDSGSTGTTVRVSIPLRNEVIDARSHPRS